MNSRTRAVPVWGLAVVFGVGGVLETVLQGFQFNWPAAVLCVAAALFIPIAAHSHAWLASTGILSIHVVAAFLPEGAFPILLFLSWFPAAGLLWFRRKRAAALVLSAGHVYLYSTWLDQGMWVPELGSLVMAVGFSVVVLVAAEASYRLSKSVREQKEKRTELAETLHTQVAGYLTRALLELEVLPACETRGRNLGMVESDIRSALTSARQLLGVLSDSTVNLGFSR